MSLLSIEEIIEGTIESLAFGGEGILRYRGFVVFVPFTAIGDRITCEITEIKRSFAKGRLVEQISRSPSHVNPRCPYFGICGGCQLQHLNEEAQLMYKKSTVYDALKRIGHLDVHPPAIIPASMNWAYRRHITLHLKPSNETFEAGYITLDNESLVVVNTCPIFNDSHVPILEKLQLLVSQLNNPHQQSGRVTLLKNHRSQFILSFQFSEGFELNTKIFQIALQQEPLFAGFLIQVGREKPLIFGDIYCEEQIENLNVCFTPQTFSQNHPEQSAKIYRQIMQIAEQIPNRQILDLYCGFGVTSLLLARQGHRVIGVESNPESIRFAQLNANNNHLKQVQFMTGKVEKVLPHLLKTKRVDFILVNPPRTGLSDDVIKILLAAQPRHLLYVSCMPATLARDLKQLCEKVYRIKEETVYDMFPQTAHVETLIYLEKKEYNRSVHFK